jgi:hypothetical protein
LTGLSVTAITDPTIDLFGLDCDDLQEDVVVGDDAITGSLKYVDDYSSAFSGDEASGNFIALHAEVPDVDDVNITITITNPSTLDEDGCYVGRIADKDSQTITVVASKDGYDDVTKVYDLSGLTCAYE